MAYIYLIFVSLSVVLASKERVEDQHIADITDKLVKVLEKRLNEWDLDENNGLDDCSFSFTNGSIIRTHDSLEAGATFIKSPVVPSRESCQEVCCDIGNCNLAVYKDKIEENSCYLFDCGTPSVCLFTSHPGFLVMEMPHRETTNKKLAQHEEALENLAATTVSTTPETDPPTTTSTTTTTTEPTTTTTTTTTTAPQNIQPVPLFGECESHKDCAGSATECLAGYCVCQEGFHAQDGACRKECSRFEFECQNEGQPLSYPQCIAIYDKCDNIVHCKDGSDERQCDDPASQQGSASNQQQQVQPQDYPVPSQYVPGHQQQQQQLGQSAGYGAYGMGQPGASRSGYADNPQGRPGYGVQGNQQAPARSGGFNQQPVQQQPQQQQRFGDAPQNSVLAGRNRAGPDYGEAQQGPSRSGGFGSNVQGNRARPDYDHGANNPGAPQQNSRPVFQGPAQQPIRGENPIDHQPQPRPHSIQRKPGVQDQPQQQQRVMTSDRPLQRNHRPLDMMKDSGSQDDNEKVSTTSTTTVPTTTTPKRQMPTTAMIAKTKLKPSSQQKLHPTYWNFPDTDTSNPPGSADDSASNYYGNYAAPGYNRKNYNDAGYKGRKQQQQQQQPPSLQRNRGYYQNSGAGGGGAGEYRSSSGRGGGGGYNSGGGGGRGGYFSNLYNNGALYGNSASDYDPYYIENPAGSSSSSSSSSNLNGYPNSDYEYYSDNIPGYAGYFGYLGNSQLRKPSFQPWKDRYPETKPSWRDKDKESHEQEGTIEQNNPVLDEDVKEDRPDAVNKDTIVTDDTEKEEDNSAQQVEETPYQQTSPDTLPQVPQESNSAEDGEAEADSIDQKPTPERTESITDPEPPAVAENEVVDNGGLPLAPADDEDDEVNNIKQQGQSETAKGDDEDPDSGLESDEETEHSSVYIGTAQNNKGAIIALALGLIITAMLLMFVGCRLRNMKRRLRKGRPLNSNEADYLINGMYL